MNRLNLSLAGGVYHSGAPVPPRIYVKFILFGIFNFNEKNAYLKISYGSVTTYLSVCIKIHIYLEVHIHIHMHIHFPCSCSLQSEQAARQKQNKNKVAHQIFLCSTILQFTTSGGIVAIVG